MGCTITIQYKPSVQLTEESLTIVIEDTTYGALTIFENDLKKLIKPLKGDENFTQLTYNELLNTLINALHTKLNEDL